VIKGRNQLAVQARLQSAMRDAGIKALLVTSAENVFYCTGFASYFLYSQRKAGVAVGIVPAKGKCTVIANDFEKQTAIKQCQDVHFLSYGSWIFIDDVEDTGDQREKPAVLDLGTSISLAFDVIKSSPGKGKIAVEFDSLPWTLWQKLEAEFGNENIVDAVPLLRAVRSVKFDWEIELLKKSAQIAERAMAATARTVEPGMAESDLLSIYRRTALALDKDVIDTFMVPSLGPLFAPAYIPRDYTIKEGDVIRLDGGVNYMGYRSDLARTFVVGKPSRRSEQIYEALIAGRKKALSMIGPGVSFREVFEATQSIVRAAGIPKYVRGHFGHSIGLDVFVEEPPFIGPNERGGFAVNMVFCVEVPYYSAVNGGFNVEDEIVITKDGYESFTKANEDLLWVRGE